MAHRGVSFDIEDHFMEAGLESPADEDVVHDSFNRLIEEQTQDLNSYQEAIEMNPLQEESEDFLSFAIDEQGGETEPLVEERWSSDTLRVLSSMPSRTIGRSRGAILSQYYSRTMQMCRHRQNRPSIRSFSRSARPSICGYRVDSNAENFDREENKRERLVNNLQNLSAGDRVRMIKAIPLNLEERRKLSHLANSGRSTYLDQVPCCNHLRDCFLISLKQMWYSWLSFVSSLQLWQTALKTVSGRFGTGVLSYFVFLRKLFFFNVFLFLIMGLFLVIPQAVRPPKPDKKFMLYGLEVLTGTGYFKNSVMYYGYYINYTFIENCSDGTQSSCGPHLFYNMPLAYFITIGVAFFVTCIILVYSMSKSFGQSFRIDRSKGLLAIKVFSSWDFKVSKKTSVGLQSENITTQLKELLAEVNREKVKSPFLQRVPVFLIQSLAWVICIVSTGVCSLGVYYFAEDVHKNYIKSSNGSDFLKEARMLALPVVVSSINLLLPGFFNVVAWMEDYESPSTHNYIAIFRNLMLKMSLLAVLCHHWLGQVATGQNKSLCWESLVGQELYRLLLMDFIFTMLDTFFGEFLWRLFSQKVLKRERKPVFDIARNVLELIYGQTLAWLGVLFSPLLPVVQVIKLFLIFYMKKTSLMMNCQAPRKAWRASQMTTFFITLLCFPSFLGASVCVTYTMWTIKPSDNCGPFRGLTTMFQAGKIWVKDLATDNTHLTWLPFVHSYLVENPFFLFLTAGIFIIVIYFHSQVVDGQRKVIELLQEQIENEGEDKKFLITRLQDIHEQKRPHSQHHSRATRQESSFT